MEVVGRDQHLWKENLNCNAGPQNLSQTGGKLWSEQWLVELSHSESKGWAGIPQPCSETTWGLPQEEHALRGSYSLLLKHNPEGMVAWCCLLMAPLQLGRDPSLNGDEVRRLHVDHTSVHLLLTSASVRWQKNETWVLFDPIHFQKRDKLKSSQFSKVLSLYISEFWKCLFSLSGISKMFHPPSPSKPNTESESQATCLMLR